MLNKRGSTVYIPNFLSHLCSLSKTFTEIWKTKKLLFFCFFVLFDLLLMFWPAFSDHLSIGVFMAALVEKYGIEETEDAIKKIPRSKFMNIFSPMQNENFLKYIFNLNKGTHEYLDSRGLSIALSESRIRFLGRECA
ncbi:hypothetical protein Bca4012_049342 [Brassica carinata]